MSEYNQYKQHLK